MREYSKIEQEIDTIVESYHASYKVWRSFGTSNELIARAEEKLQITFTEEYRAFLRVVAGLSIIKRGQDGLLIWHDMTSLSRFKDVDEYTLIGITKRARETFKEFPSNAYPIEEVAKEECYIIQKESGEICMRDIEGEEEYIADSFFTYMRSL